MHPDERDVAYLWDMVDAAESIRQFTVDVSFEEYLVDRKVQMAVEHALEIIGEAAKGISIEFREARPEVPWRLVIAQRNVLAHEYGDIKQDRIWAVITQNLPQLIAQLRPLIGPLPPEPGR